MLEGFIKQAKDLAESFVETKQDIFVMTADVEGEQVVVSLKFAPREKVIRNEDIWKDICARNIGTVPE